jgi:hypothetical protein
LKKKQKKTMKNRFVPSGDVATMTAADSAVSCRRSPLFEPILGRFFSPNHRAMHADQVQVRVRVRAFRVPQHGSTL